MALCPGPEGGPKVLSWYIFSYTKGEKLGPGGHGAEASPGSATEIIIYIYLVNIVTTVICTFYVLLL